MKKRIKSFLINQGKNGIIKHILPYKRRERYQANSVLLPNYVWDGFKYYKFKNGVRLNKSLQFLRRK